MFLELQWSKISPTTIQMVSAPWESQKPVPQLGEDNYSSGEINPVWPKPELFSDNGNKVHKLVSAILKSKGFHLAFIIHLAVKLDLDSGGGV